MKTNIKKTTFHKQTFWFTLLLILFSTFELSIFAQGNLLVYPTRIVSDGKKMSEKIVLTNTGKDSAVYDISFIEYKMTKYGEMKIINEPEEGMNFASPNLRYFPKKVILAPFQSQTLKVQVRNTQSLKDGEYRSHLYFRSKERSKKIKNNEQATTSEVSVKLKPVIGVSIPFIYRKGTNTTTSSISDLQLVQQNREETFVKFNLNRIGNMSIYGDFTATFKDQKNKTHTVSYVQGVGVYTPENLRIIKLKLSIPEGLNLKDGTLQVVFTKNESQEVLSEANLIL